MSVKRGFALIFVLGFAACVIAFAAVIGARATQNLRFASTKGQASRALGVAETGTQLVFSCLREPPVMRNPDNTINTTLTWLGDDCTVIVPMPSVAGVAYAHLYHNIASLGSQATSIAPDNTPIGVDNFYIVSVGAVNSLVDNATGEFVGGVRYEQVTMGTTLQPSFPMLPQAAFASNALKIDGRVDYFDSKQAQALWSSNAAAADGTYPEASVALDQLTVPSGTIGGSAKVLGNFLISSAAAATEVNAVAGFTSGGVLNATDPLGPPGSILAPNQYALPGAVATGNPSQQVTGEVARLSAARPPFVMANDETKIVQPHFASGSAHVGTVLDEGKIYKQEGNLDLGSTAQITVDDVNGDGKTEDAILLVEGDIKFALGARVNDKEPPRQLKIYSLKASGGQFTMASGAEAYCLVAGADLTVDIATGSQLWGAVMGKTVTLAPGAKIHFDVALRNPTIMADVYDFRIISSVSSQGAKMSPGVLALPGGAYGGSSTGTSGTGTSGTGTSGSTGGGCGCGGGSMLMAAKV